MDCPKNKYDSLAAAQQKTLEENRQYKAQNQQLSSALQSLKDSLAYYQKASLAGSQIRRKIIDQYLLNKSFGLVYYNSRDGMTPDGASYFIISKENNKYYTTNQVGIKSTTTVANNKDTQRYKNWKMSFDGQLNYTYRIGNDFLREGKLHYDYTAAEEVWKNMSLHGYLNMLNAANQNLWDEGGSFLLSEAGMIVPLYLMEDDYKEYKVYFFWGELYGTRNPIVLEAHNVIIVLAEVK